MTNCRSPERHRDRQHSCAGVSYSNPFNVKIHLQIGRAAIQLVGTDAHGAAILLVQAYQVAMGLAAHYEIRAVESGQLGPEGTREAGEWAEEALVSDISSREGQNEEHGSHRGAW